MDRQIFKELAPRLRKLLSAVLAKAGRLPLQIDLRNNCRSFAIGNPGAHRGAPESRPGEN
jgi:hypothetical protein